MFVLDRFTPNCLLDHDFRKENKTNYQNSRECKKI